MARKRLRESLNITVTVTTRWRGMNEWLWRHLGIDQVAAMNTMRETSSKKKW